MKLQSPDQAAALLRDGQTVISAGFVGAGASSRPATPAT